MEHAWEQLRKHGQLKDAWAQIAPGTEAQRLEDLTNRENEDKMEEFDDIDIPDLANTDATDQLRSLVSVELISDSVRAILKNLNLEQQQIFYFVQNSSTE